MADCKRCDRCGAFYDTSDVFKKDIPKISKEKIKGFTDVLSYSLGGNTIAFHKIDLKSSNDSWIGPIDLCPKCGESFYKWLVSDEEDSNGEQSSETPKEKA